MKKTLKVIYAVLIFILACGALAACNFAKKNDNFTSYKIDAILDDANKVVNATMEVNYYNSYETSLSEVKFNLYPNAYRQTAEISPISDLKIDEAYPNGISYGDISIKKVSIGEEEQTPTIEGEDENILTVKLKDELKPTQSKKIYIEFSVKLANVRHRLGYFGKTINLGNWYPIACVYEGGEFVETPYIHIGDPFYSNIANYNVTVTAPLNYTVASSGNLLSSVPNSQNETVVTSFEAEDMRDFALVIGELTVVSETVGSTKVNYYYNEDLKVKENMQTAVDALVTFNSLFGAYPYKTLSVVKTAFLQGGMEYPGLVYISDKLSPSSFTETIVHEIAHQWWACVVGNNQSQDAWLDEGLCEYSVALFFEANSSYEVTLRERIAGTLSSYILYLEMYKDNGKDNTAMNRKIKDYTNELEYAYLNYAQGEILFNAVRELIGKDAFISGLKNYYKNNKYKIATPDHLIGELEKASNYPLKDYFNSWVEGTVQSYAD